MTVKSLTGILLDEQTEVSLYELCDACATSTEWVVELVDEGVLEPLGKDQARWRFSGPSLIKARTALRMQEDLKVNLAGVALVLDLMEEIEEMRERLRRLEFEASA
jgi:chaperone modulatory protein CbpM